MRDGETRSGRVAGATPGLSTVIDRAFLEDNFVRWDRLVRRTWHVDDPHWQLHVSNRATE